MPVKTIAGRKAPPPAAPPADAVHRHLGRRVKHLRTERGWSLEALAGASGVSRSMLSQIEREHANPTLAVTLRLARASAIALPHPLATPVATSLPTPLRS